MVCDLMQRVAGGFNTIYGMHEDEAMRQQLVKERMPTVRVAFASCKLLK
jgi:hypothetical protein